jgi:hypothetical protein
MNEICNDVIPYICHYASKPPPPGDWGGWVNSGRACLRILRRVSNIVPFREIFPSPPRPGTGSNIVPFIPPSPSGVERGASYIRDLLISLGDFKAATTATYIKKY